MALGHSRNSVIRSWFRTLGLETPRTWACCTTGQQRLLGPPARLHEARHVAALTDLGKLEARSPHTHVPPAGEHVIRQVERLSRGTVRATDEPSRGPPDSAVIAIGAPLSATVSYGWVNARTGPTVGVRIAMAADWAYLPSRSV